MVFQSKAANAIALPVKAMGSVICIVAPVCGGPLGEASQVSVPANAVHLSCEGVRRQPRNPGKANISHGYRRAYALGSSKCELGSKHPVLDLRKYKRHGLTDSLKSPFTAGTNSISGTRFEAHVYPGPPPIETSSKVALPSPMFLT